MMRDADKNNDGKLDFKEFSELMASKIGVQGFSKSDMQLAFTLFDKDSNGTISFTDVKKVC